MIVCSAIQDLFLRFKNDGSPYNDVCTILGCIDW
jgi:hypothetical protein